jgi:hypothetical protein
VLAGGLLVGLGAAAGYLVSQRSGERATILRMLEQQQQAIDRMQSRLARPVIVEREPAVPPAQPPEVVPEPGSKSAAPAASSPPPAGALEGRSPEAQVAFDGARAVLDAAVAYGRWTAKDRAEFRRLLPQMTPEDRFEVSRLMAVAINQQKLVPEEPGPPF